jgi:Rrf2 family transcriptional regulator, iron-sulfur cluster assembly transcription factor
MLEKTTKYAIKALMYLAQLAPDTFVQVSKLSRDIQVPGPYLSKIVKTLAAKGIVTTRKGINGGVRINARIRDLTFFDICSALDDPIVHPRCLLQNAPCGKGVPCSHHKEWSFLREQIAQHLTQLRLVS